jgi:hypothetical protein
MFIDSSKIFSLAPSGAECDISLLTELAGCMRSKAINIPRLWRSKPRNPLKTRFVITHTFQPAGLMAGGYSYLSATNGSTRVARRAGR